MSFSLSVDDGKLEWASHDASTVLRSVVSQVPAVSPHGQGNLRFKNALAAA